MTSTSSTTGPNEGGPNRGGPNEGGPNRGGPNEGGLNHGGTNVRIERDSMGPMEVPAAALYGASTMRAVLNFPISDLRFPRGFIQALGLVKLAAARTNQSLGMLDEKIANAIVEAAQEVADGKLDEHFVLDIFQTGSGTSTNTNANEVIANRATLILGGGPGDRLVHPNDHVNMGQSSNDVIPSAIHLAALIAIDRDLIPALEKLKSELSKKSDEFWPVIKTGRTHLQDATSHPVRPGVSGLCRTGGIQYPTAAPGPGGAGRGCAGRHCGGHRGQYP